MLGLDGVGLVDIVAWSRVVGSAGVASRVVDAPGARSNRRGESLLSTDRLMTVPSSPSSSCSNFNESALSRRCVDSQPQNCLQLTGSPPKLRRDLPPPAPEATRSRDLTTPAGVFFFLTRITATLPLSSSSPSSWLNDSPEDESAAAGVEAGAERRDEVEPEGRSLLRFLKVETGVVGPSSSMLSLRMSLISPD